jgi:hypothetical protein
LLPEKENPVSIGWETEWSQSRYYHNGGVKYLCTYLKGMKFPPLQSLRHYTDSATQNDIRNSVIRTTLVITKKFLLRTEKSKDVKTGWYNSSQIWQNVLGKAMAQKGCSASAAAAYRYIR